MRTATRAKVLMAGLLGGALIAGPGVSPVGAVLKQHVACSKVNAPPLSTSGKLTSTFAGCTPTALKNGGKSTVKPGTGSTSGKLVMTLVWNNGKGKTVATVKYTQQKTRRRCKPGTSRITLTGKVTGGTGAAAKVIKKGEPLTGSVCAVTSGTKAGKTVIEPNTKFKL